MKFCLDLLRNHYFEVLILHFYIIASFKNHCNIFVKEKTINYLKLFYRGSYKNIWTIAFGSNCPKFFLIAKRIIFSKVRGKIYFLYLA